MALDSKQKEKLEKLALEKEGVAFVGHKPRATTTPTIVISLGGLGGETLNAIKAKLVKSVDNTSSVQFLAVDTCVEDMSKLLKGGMNSMGALNVSETFGLYDPATSFILMNGGVSIPPAVRRWLAPGFPEVQIDDKGAQGRRQIGRLMLVAGSSYQKLENKIASYLKNAHQYNVENGTPDNGIEVIIIAGISGGTGSGTIIDVSYLIQRQITEMGLDAVTQVSAYVYTPDVQFNEIGIQGKAPVISNLKKNGYAAFKEIDYFMSLTAHKGTYELAFSENNVYVSRKNIFDTCYVISGSAAVGMHTKADAIAALSENLMDLLTDITYMQAGAPVQMAKAFSSNRVSNLQAWYQKNGEDKVQYPKNANYRYSVLGYSAVSIPKQEIITYCVYKMFQKVQEEFKSINLVNAEMVDEVLDFSNLLGLDRLVTYSMGVLTEDPVNQQISIHEANLPTKKDIKDEVDSTYSDAVSLASNEAWKVTNDQYKKFLVENLTGALQTKIAEIFDAHGPYYVVELLTHKPMADGVEPDPSRAFSGVLYFLYNLKNQVISRYNEAVAYGVSDSARGMVMAAREDAIGLFSGKDKIRAYADRMCEVVFVTNFWAPYYNALNDVLDEVITNITNENNKIWEVYTDVLDAVSRILEKDADYITNSERHGNTYSYQVINLYEGDSKAKKLQKYLEDFASPKSIGELTSKFIESMRNHREDWTEKTNMDNFHVDQEVRKIFEEVLEGQLGTDIIEKFVVAAYSPNQLSPSEIDQIWANNAPEKEKAIISAAEEIKKILVSKGRLLARMKDGYSESVFLDQKLIATLKETPQLSQALFEQYAGQQITQATSNGLTKYISSTIIFNLPLYVLAGFSDYDKEYRFNVEQNKTVGIHMDENSQDWRRFPQPFTLDIAAKDGLEYKKFHDYEVLMEIKEKADQAFNASLLPEDDKKHYGFINMITPSKAFFTLDNITDEPANKDAFRQFVYNKMIEAEVGEEPTLRDLITDPASGYVTVPVDLTIAEHDLLDVTDLEGKGRSIEIGDFYKMMRMSMHYTELLNRNLEKWAAAEQVVESVANEIIVKKKFVINMRTFCNCMKVGFIQKDPTYPNILTYQMKDKREILLDMRAQAPFDREYFMYHAFSAFSKLDDRVIADLRKRSQPLITGMEDTSEITDHIETCLDDMHLTDLFARETIREGVSTSTMDYTFTDQDEIKKDPYKVLLRFYQTLKRQF